MKSKWKEAPFGTNGKGEVWLWNGEPRHILDINRCYVDNPAHEVKLATLEEAKKLGVEVSPC